MKQKNALIILSLLLLTAAAGIYGKAIQTVKRDKNNSGMAFVTYAADYEQERKAACLIKSIRDRGGKFSQSPIYVVLGDIENYPCNSLKSKGVTLLPAELDADLLNYPLAIKAYAAAMVERIVGNECTTLTWLDPETLLLGEINDLDLKNNYSVAVKPVFLVNAIGLTPETEPGIYWNAIFSATGLNWKDVPVVESVADKKKIRAYYNCEVFSVNPSLGIFKQWADELTKLIRNKEYQASACKTFIQKLFLHQAVLSAVITSKVKQDKINPLPITCGYPFNLHEKLPADIKAAKLNSLSCMIYETVWENNHNWLSTIGVNEPLKKWITNIYLDFIKIGTNIYRIEGIGNSYIVTTKAGSVIIDPTGAASAPFWFEEIIKKYPLKAILLTHGHNDHKDSIQRWKKDLKIPVIAQKEYVEFRKYHDRLAGFFVRRNSIWARKPVPPNTGDITVTTSIEPTILYTDNYTYKLGGLTFKMIHVAGETPDHSVIYIPELKTAFIGDNYSFQTSFPNIYTVRGTKPRWALDYIAALDTVLKLKPEFLMPGHSIPLTSSKLINKYLTDNRNAIQYVHDETVKGMNEGKDVFTLMKEIKLPEKYNYLNQSYGRVSWSVRGIYEGYAGFFDENPATLYDQPASSIFSDLASLTTTDAILKTAEDYFAKGNFVKVLHLTDAALTKEAANKPALELKMKALKELRTRSRNYIENIWLDYGIRTTEAGLSGK